MLPPTKLSPCLCEVRKNERHPFHPDTETSSFSLSPSWHQNLLTPLLTNVFNCLLRSPTATTYMKGLTTVTSRTRRWSRFPQWVLPPSLYPSPWAGGAFQQFPICSSLPCLKLFYWIPPWLELIIMAYSLAMTSLASSGTPHFYWCSNDIKTSIVLVPCQVLHPSVHLCTCWSCYLESPPLFLLSFKM